MATVTCIKYERQSIGALHGVAGYVSQEEIQLLDADIEVLLMERIRDKDHTERYDSLIAKLSSEQAAAHRGLCDLQSGNIILRREIKALEKRIAELDAMLGHTPIEKVILHRLIHHVPDYGIR